MPDGERSTEQWLAMAAKMYGVPEQKQLAALGTAPDRAPLDDPQDFGTAAVQRVAASGTIFDHADALVDLVRRLRALGATDVALGGVRVVFVPEAPGAADAVSTGVAAQPDGPAPPPPLDAAGPAPRTPPTPPPPTDLDMTLMSS